MMNKRIIAIFMAIATVSGLSAHKCYDMNGKRISCSKNTECYDKQGRTIDCKHGHLISGTGEFVGDVAEGTGKVVKGAGEGIANVFTLGGYSRAKEEKREEAREARQERQMQQPMYEDEIKE